MQPHRLHPMLTPFLIVLGLGLGCTADTPPSQETSPQATPHAPGSASNSPASERPQAQKAQPETKSTPPKAGSRQKAAPGHGATAGPADAEPPTHARAFGDASQPYPATAGQIVDRAIYKGLYYAMLDLDKKLNPNGALPDPSQPGAAKASAAKDSDKPKGTLLTLWHTGNVHGEREDCGCPKRPLGGLARKATLIQEASKDPKALHRPDGALIVDAGDLLFKHARVGKMQGNPRKVALIEAEAIVDAFNIIGCHGFAVGAYDLAMGAEALDALHARAKFPWISANLHRKGQPKLMFKPFVKTEWAGLKVVLVGITNGQDSDPLEALGFSIDDPVKALQAQSKAIRAAKPDVVVLLSNLGVAKTQTMLDALDKSPGSFPIHTAVLSNTGRMTFKPVWHNNTFMVEAGSRGKYLGRLDLHVVEDKVVFEPEDNTQSRMVRDYMNSYRSLHNARRNLHKTQQKQERTAKVERMARSVIYSTSRLEKIEHNLPAQLELDTAHTEESPSWIRAELLPVDITLKEDPAVRRVLDKHIARAKPLGGGKHAPPH